VPQFDNLDPDFTVRENLLVFSRYFGISAPAARALVPPLLEFAKLENKADARVGELSGGMKRRLTLARALVNDPDVLVLDEPTGLDPQARHLMWERLRSLLARGKTILITTHFMEEAERLCDRLCVIEEGRKIAEGAPHALIESEIGCDVIEIYGPDPVALRDEVAPFAERTEISGETLFCYVSDPNRSPRDSKAVRDCAICTVRPIWKTCSCGSRAAKCRTDRPWTFATFRLHIVRPAARSALRDRAARECDQLDRGVAAQLSGVAKARARVAVRQSRRSDDLPVRAGIRAGADARARRRRVVYRVPRGRHGRFERDDVRELRVDVFGLLAHARAAHVGSDHARRSRSATSCSGRSSGARARRCCRAPRSCWSPACSAMRGFRRCSRRYR
jgi:hypothetical protein